eukprot:g33922.t1
MAAINVTCAISSRPHSLTHSHDTCHIDSGHLIQPHSLTHSHDTCHMSLTHIDHLISSSHTHSLTHSHDTCHMDSDHLIQATLTHSLTLMTHVTLIATISSHPLTHSIS